MRSKECSSEGKAEINFKKELEEMKESQENQLESENDLEKDEKSKKRTIFNDLRRFKRHDISILTFGGEVVKGKLIGYDEVANCVLETEQKRKVVVFGKLILMVCDGELHTF